LIEAGERLEIKASVHQEGSTAAAPIEELMLTVQSGPNGQSAQRNDDGTWHFSGLAPDIYRVGFWSNPEHYFVKRVLLNGELQAGTVIDLLAHHPQSMEIVLGVSTGSIVGVVTNGKESAPAATIALMDEATQEMVRLQGAPAASPFEIKQVAPGKYRLYALEDFDREAWGSQELRVLLSTKSVVFELGDGERRQVSLPVVSAAEFQAGARKVAY
jgi:hypothetical protein